MLLAIVVRNARRPLAILPASPLGRGQLLYLVLLGWGSLLGTSNAPWVSVAQRPVTEGGTYVVALICSLSCFLGTPDPPAIEPSTGREPVPGWPGQSSRDFSPPALSIVIDWAVVRAIYGDRFAGYANKHIRFGPDATIHRPDRQ